MSFPATYSEEFHSKEDVLKMKYVPLGETGLKVSVIGFGAGCFGNHYGDFKLQTAKNVIYEAVRRGINYIDTAPYYGEGRSEKTLGIALRDIPRTCYYIATKVGRYSMDPARAFDFSYKNVAKSVNDSLMRLGLKYVDVIQVHDIEFAPTLDVVMNETLPALRDLVKQGKAKFIGITGYPVSKLKALLERSPVKIDCVLSYCRMTLIDDTLRDFIPFFKSKKVGIIHASPPAMGLLTNRGPWDWHPVHEVHKQICKEAAQYCKERNVELGKLAVYYTLSQIDIDIHLIGMPSMELLDMNLDTAINGITSKEEEVLGEVQKKFFKPSDRMHWEDIEVDRYKQDLAALPRS